MWNAAPLQARLPWCPALQPTPFSKLAAVATGDLLDDDVDELYNTNMTD